MEKAYYYRSHNRRNEEGKVNLHVREENKPFIPRPLSELSSALGTTHTASGILATNSYIKLAQSHFPFKTKHTNSKEEPIHHECRNQSMRAPSAIRPCSQSRKEDDDESGPANSR